MPQAQDPVACEQHFCLAGRLVTSRRLQAMPNNLFGDQIVYDGAVVYKYRKWWQAMLSGMSIDTVVLDAISLSHPTQELCSRYKNQDGDQRCALLAGGLIDHLKPNSAKPPNVTLKLSSKLLNTMDVRAREPGSKSDITVSVLVTGANRYAFPTHASCCKRSNITNRYPYTAVWVLQYAAVS